jgi:hypothetical protein
VSAPDRFFRCAVAMQGDVESTVHHSTRGSHLPCAEETPPPLGGAMFGTAGTATGLTDGATFLNSMCATSDKGMVCWRPSLKVMTRALCSSAKAGTESGQQGQKGGEAYRVDGGAHSFSASGPELVRQGLGDAGQCMRRKTRHSGSVFR